MRCRAMSRLQKSLTDYVVLAINPVLIMVLICSLMLMLSAVLYGGHQQTRLHTILILFSCASVLIGRISIEEGRQYASLFALALGGVAWLGLNKFVQYHGPLAGFSGICNLSLIAIVLWCADTLVRDCTLVDDRQDSSGEGLLQTVGLDRPAGKAQPAAAASGDNTAITPNTKHPTPTSAWSWLRDRFLRRRRGHTPGVWAVYFSLAGLPLFGIGQRFVPSSDLAGRRFVFLCLIAYMASALGLLLCTSFLGLRRYLRQRQIEMPESMAAVWLGAGAATIAALLLACLLLPRPAAEYSITQLDLKIAGSRTGQKTSQQSGFRDGTEPGQRSASKERGSNPQNSTTNKNAKPGESSSANSQPQDSGPSSPAHPPNSKSGQSDAGKPDSSQSNSAGSRPLQMQPQEAGEQRPESKPSGTSDSPPKPADSPTTQAKPSGEGKSNGADKPDRGQTASTQGQPREAAKPPPAQNENADPFDDRHAVPEEQAKADSREQEQPQDETLKQSMADASAVSSPPLVNRLLGIVPAMLKVLYYLGVFAFVGFFAWKFRAQIRAAIADFLQAIRELWARLFGSQATPAPAAAEDSPSVPVARTFADFADPFAGGAATRMSPRQLVIYSFAATEAWAGERGCGRDSEQTPHEFANQVATQCGSLRDELRLLVDLYCQAAYAPQAPLPAGDVRRLAGLWTKLRQPAA